MIDARGGHSLVPKMAAAASASAALRLGVGAVRGLGGGARSAGRSWLGWPSAAARGFAGADVGAPPPATCDLTDAHMPDPVDVTQKSTRVACLPPGLRDFGGRSAFAGTAVTIKCFENNPLVRKALCDENGKGKVLVVDGGGSTRCALLGDMLAAAGAENGWEGIIIDGCVRDSKALKTTYIGVKARDTHPLKSSKRDPGERDVDIVIGGVHIAPGDHVYADEDGVVVSKDPLV